MQTFYSEKTMKAFYTKLSKLCQCDIADNILYTQALTHKSWIAENKVDFGDYERLEFLGDAILNMIVSDLLYQKYPDKSEGDLTQYRASLVNERILGETLLEHCFNQYIQLGLGEAQSGGHKKLSILSDVYESILAAIYLDQGIDTAKIYIAQSLGDRLDHIKNIQWYKDYKTLLQEKTQKLFKELPTYNTLKTFGPDHDKRFMIKLHIQGYTFEGEGSSKKQAQQDAAKQALQQFSKIKGSHKK